MFLISDRVLRCTAWILFVVAIGVLIGAIYLPMKALIAQDATTSSKPQPVHTQKPLRKHYRAYEVIKIDNRFIIGDV